MHPRTTSQRPAQPDIRFLIGEQQAMRASHQRTPQAPTEDQTITSEPEVDAAERDRQDSLAFLHGLVMGRFDAQK